MKAKIKRFILYFTLSFGVLVIIMLIMNIGSLKSQLIEVKRSDGFEEKLSILRIDTESINDYECRELINNYLDNIEKINVEGTYTIKEYYYKIYSKNHLMPYYKKTLDSCNISESEVDDNYLSSILVSNVLTYEHILQNSLFSYEIGFKDRERDIYESSDTNLDLRVTGDNELLYASKLIELVREKEISEVENEG